MFERTAVAHHQARRPQAHLDDFRGRGLVIKFWVPSPPPEDARVGPRALKVALDPCGLRR